MDAIGLAVSVVALAFGAIGTYLGWRSSVRTRDAAQFREVRKHLADRLPDLITIAENAQRGLCSDAELPLLNRPGWIPAGPIPLAEVPLSFRGVRPDESLTPARHRVRGYWPREPSGRFESYSQAIGELTPPKLWFNGPSYRLLEVRDPVADAAGGRLHFVFGEASYFDGVDTAEPLAYELGLRHLQRRRRVWPGPYRRWLSDGFSLQRRCALPGVNTLTLRVERGRTTFFLHSRDPKQVAAMNTTHVVPAGEFQPHSKALGVWHSDLDLWHTIMREYAEEFLGAEDAAQAHGTEIDFEHDPPYSQFNRALRALRLRAYLLGLGLEPMTWKPEFCTVCVWDAASFDRVFGRMITRNDEGDLIVGNRHHGLEFNAVNVAEYTKRPEMDPAGRACLTLAWRWRHELALSLAEGGNASPKQWAAN